MKKLLYILLIPCCILQTMAQSTISGTVTDSKMNAPVTGATIIVNDTNLGAITDFDGKFTLDNVPDDATLTVRFIGYITKSIKVDGKTTFSIVLEEDFQSLDEVVVIGYGTQSKRDLTGAVGTVKTEEIAAAPASNFDQALAGRIAGVQVTTSDGTPGSAANIVIRGGNSITSDNTPLYVIDGVPLSEFDPASLNTNDIESLYVLKDASSTAIYGSRGSNGVILITTKGGRSDGKTEVSLSINSGIQYAPNRLKVMSPYQYVSYLEQNALILDNYNPGTETSFFLETWEDKELYRNVKGTSWQDEIFKLASFQDYNLSVSGGSSSTQIYFSGQYVDQEGVVINTGFNKAISNLRVKHEVNDFMNLDANLVYSLSNRTGSSVSGNGSSGNIIRDALVFRPVEPINDDEFEGFDMEDGSNRYLFNPVKNLINTDRSDRRELFRATLRSTNKISKTLDFDLVGSYQSSNSLSSLFYGKETYQGTRGNEGISGQVTNTRTTVATGSAVLNYKPKIGRKKRLGILGGIEAQSNDLERSQFSADQLPTDVFGINNLGLGLVAPIPTTLASGSTLLSYFSRVNYSYKSRYLFTANFRADGSSKFRKENRWGYFPSFSLAWIVSNESFLDKTDFISNLKFRGGWGQTGNNRIGDFDAFTTLVANSSSGYVWGDGEQYVLGAIVDNLGVPNLKWETTTQINLGLDFGLFKNRMQGELDYYIKRTSDLLLNADMASSTGFERVQQNVGEVENRGVELSLNSFNISNKNFKWNTNFNIAFNNNEVLSLNQGQDAIYTDPQRAISGEFKYITKVGKPVGQIYGLQFDGIYQIDDFNFDNGVFELKEGIPDNGANPAPGSVKYVDLNGDGTINEVDRGIIGNTIPDFIGGLTNVFEYKGVDLQVFMQWSYGLDVLNINRAELESPTTDKRNGFVALLDQWTPSNTNTDIHTLVYQTNYGRPVSGTRISDLYVEDASFVRLKTVSLGYNVPKKYLTSGFIQSARFFVSAQNLYTWTNYSGYDPEVSVSPRGGISRTLAPNLDWSAYPQSVTVVSGLKLNF